MCRDVVVWFENVGVVALEGERLARHGSGPVVWWWWTGARWGVRICRQDIDVREICDMTETTQNEKDRHNFGHVG